MDKQVVIKILERKQISQEELFIFITDYIKSEKGKDITGQELQMIFQAIQMKVFNLYYAAEQAAIKLNLQVTSLYNKVGQIIRTDVR